MKTSLFISMLLAGCYATAQAQTLQTVTDNGNNTTSNEIHLTGRGSRLVLLGNDDRWVQWRNSANQEDGWVGYGEGGSTRFGISNRLGSIMIQTPYLFDIRTRALVNLAVDDQASALQVNGNVRLSNRGQSYIVRDYATFGETVSGAATVIGNNAIANKNILERVDFSYTTSDGSNAMVMSYVHGTMFHVRKSGGTRNAGDQWFTLNDGTDEVMRLTPDRNMLIGTTADDGLHRLQVKGNIKAQKIKVTQTDWADFVFDPAYKLPSLQELDRFIQQHKHLPDIPSEQEVKENGIDLGEMNKRLLQKVEEQALYIIELDKNLASLRKQMAEIERRLEAAGK